MKKWYVIQAYTGYEPNAKDEILRVAETEGLTELIEEVVVPEETVEVDGEQVSEKLFPGYLMIKAEMSGELASLIRRTSRVSGFAGGGAPSPLSKKEEEKVFNRSKIKNIPKRESSSISIGLEIAIAKGPFSGFSGIVENVDEATGKIKVVVSIFGRMTPIDVSLDQLEK